MTPYIVIVEDDHIKGGSIEDLLAWAFPEVELEILATEEDFRSRLQSFRQEPPDLIVMDVMLRWANPVPGLPSPPPDVVQGGYYRARIRCVGLLGQDRLLRRIPVVLYTMLKLDDLMRDGTRLPANVKHVYKTDGDDFALVQTVRNCLCNGTS